MLTSKKYRFESKIKQFPRFMILITFYLVLMLQKLEFCKFFAHEKFRMLQQTFIAVLTALMAQKAESRPFKTNVLQHCTVETIQDFLIKLDIKPLMHLLEISIFSLNNVIVQPNHEQSRQKLGTFLGNKVP